MGRHRLTIRVTEDHITKGKDPDCLRDPIELAMVDAGLDRPLVSQNYVAYKVGSGCSVSIAPDPVKKFIYDFDYGNPVAPFEFEIGYFAQ